jgi:hypothetical protein
MEEVRTSETSENYKVTTRRYIPQDSKLHTRCRENLTSHKLQLIDLIKELMISDHYNQMFTIFNLIFHFIINHTKN